MKQLLEFIVRGITTKPDEVSVSESREPDGGLVFNLKVADEDFGTIIGKGGRTVQAIRDLLRIKAQKESLRYNLIIEEPAKQPDAD